MSNHDYDIREPDRDALATARAEGWRAGAEAMREAAARAIVPFIADRPRDREAMTAWSVQHECADVISSLDIPEAPNG